MKKTEFITFRTDQKTKQDLDLLANRKKWTLSFLIEEIVKEWVRSKKDGSCEIVEELEENEL